MTLDEVENIANEAYEKEYEQAKKDMDYLLGMFSLQKQMLISEKEKLAKTKKITSESIGQERARQDEIARAKANITDLQAKLQATKAEIKKLVEQKILELQQILKEILADD